MSEDLRRERNDLHVILGAELAGDRAEDAGALRVAVIADDDDGVRVEAQVAAVGAAQRGLRADDDGLHDLALLHGGVRAAFLDVDGEDVAHVGVARGVALAADHRRAARAGVVGDIKNGTHLDHGGVSWAAQACAGAAGGFSLRVLVGTACATSCSLTAATRAPTDASTMRVTRQRLRRLMGRVSMTSILSPTLV